MVKIRSHHSIHLLNFSTAKSKNSNSLPIHSENQVHEKSVDIGEIENYIEEHSNNLTKISNALLILPEKHIDDKSLQSGKNGNCIMKKLNDTSEKQRKKYSCTLEIKKISDKEIFNWTKKESPYVELNDAENVRKYNENNLPCEISGPNPEENEFVEQEILQQLV